MSKTTIHMHALFFICLLALSAPLAAQVSVNQDNSSPDPSAMLDVKSDAKGLLIPRLSSAQRNGIAAPATGLMVYDNTTNSFWYYNATAWKEITLNTDDQALSLSGTTLSIEDGNSVDLSGLSAADSWKQTGNTGITDGVDFIGTTDNTALDFRVNNQRGLRLIPKDDNSVNVIGGYSGNNISASTYNATIGGGGAPGSVNSVTADGGTVGGGVGNTASASSALVSGGEANLATGDGSTVAGGISNTAGGAGAIVAGGEENLASGNYSFAAGLAARALHPGSFVWNGDSDYAPFSSTANKQFLIQAPGGVGIGKNNPATALDVNGTVTATAFVGDGSGLTNLPGAGWSLGGNTGTTDGVDFIGTTDNTALDFRVNNQRGLRLVPRDDNSVNVIGGYSGNSISAGVYWATIGGGGAPGSANSVTADGGTVGGGLGNTVSAQSAVVSGGETNTASGYGSTVAGGLSNTAGGFGAMVAGGEENQATGDYSFAAGVTARALHSGSFVWNGDQSFSVFSSTANEQFLIKAPGGVGIGLNNPSEALEVSGNVRADAFLTPSSIRWKTNVQTIENALETVQRLRGVTYDWKKTGKHDIGLIAEEVGAVIPELVRFEANGVDVQSVDYPRLVAVLIEAVKAQQAEITALQTQNNQLETQNNAIEQRLFKLESAFQQVQVENSKSKK